MKIKLLGGLLAVTTITALGVATIPILENNVVALNVLPTQTERCGISINFGMTPDYTTTPWTGTGEVNLSAGALGEGEQISWRNDITYTSNKVYWDTNEHGLKLSSSKENGSITITLPQSEQVAGCDVYAAGWKGDTSIIEVNNHSKNVSSIDELTGQSGIASITYTRYSFNFDNETNIIEINATKRLVIGDIALRYVHEDFPDDPEPDPGEGGDIEKTLVTIVPSDGDAAESSDYSIEKNGVTIFVVGSTLTSSQIRVFKGKTITISANGNISKIEFTCTASDTAKYGPGCFAALEGYSYNGIKGIWVGNTDSITFTTSSNQVRITEIKVTYQPNN